MHLKLKPLPLEKRGKFYHDEGTPSSKAASDIEDIILKKKLYGIGDPQWREKNIPRLPAGQLPDERAGGLDMTIAQRVYRTVDVKKMDEAGLAELHAWEQKKMSRFVCGPEEINRIVKGGHVPNQKFLGKKLMPEIEKFNNKNRPEPDRFFHGIPIPAYFIYDLEFDGMNYHHAWDKNVWSIFYPSEIDFSSMDGKAKTRNYLKRA